MRKDFYLVTDHPLYELIVKKPTSNKCMEMMSAIAAKDKGSSLCANHTSFVRSLAQSFLPSLPSSWVRKGSPDPTIKIDLNFELGETMNRTGTQWGGCYIKLTPSKHSMSRKSRLRERVIPYPAYPGDPAVYSGPLTTPMMPMGGVLGNDPPSPPGMPLPFAPGMGTPDPRQSMVRMGKRGEEDDVPQESRPDSNGQDENGSFQSAMSWLYGTWGSASAHA